MNDKDITIWDSCMQMLKMENDSIRKDNKAVEEIANKYGQTLDKDNLIQEITDVTEILKTKTIKDFLSFLNVEDPNSPETINKMKDVLKMYQDIVNTELYSKTLNGNSDMAAERIIMYHNWGTLFLTYIQNRYSDTFDFRNMPKSEYITVCSDFLLENCPNASTWDNARLAITRINKKYKPDIEQKDMPQFSKKKQNMVYNSNWSDLLSENSEIYLGIDKDYIKLLIVNIKNISDALPDLLSCKTTKDFAVTRNQYIETVDESIKDPILTDSFNLIAKKIKLNCIESDLPDFSSIYKNSKISFLKTHEKWNYLCQASSYLYSDLLMNISAPSYTIPINRIKTKFKKYYAAKSLSDLSEQEYKRFVEDELALYIENPIVYTINARAFLLINSVFSVNSDFILSYNDFK